MKIEHPSLPPALALTTRLVLGYMLVAFFTLSAAAVFLHEILDYGFEVEDAGLMSDHVRLLRREMLESPEELGRVREIIGATANAQSLEKYFGRLLEDDGTTLVETRGYEELAVAREAFPKPVGVSDNLQKVVRSRSLSGTPLFLASALMTRRAGEPPLVYLVALDITHVDNWLEKFRVQLFFVVVTGTVISGLLAWFLTRTGLRPLQEITAGMQRVGAKGLDERLSRNRWPHELAAMAGEFDLMLERLHEAFQRLSQFSADAAHEFRTPLNNLMVSTSFLLSRDHDKEEYRQALVANFAEFERMKRLVDSLLFLARADNAEAVIKKTVVDARVLAGGVVDFFSALAEEHGVMLVSDGSGELLADETLLRMALANLVSNALRHTPRGGRVSVLIDGRLDDCKITVTDSGIGIDEVHLPRLFDRFYRVDAARSSVAADAGVGLGLALVKTVASLHGGSVEVWSKQGLGTSMTLLLPRRCD
ncbi:heavy metal sensor histidine kinase [Phragmitibacter flavus]|nr:heavy metal sensor histidine kinase [Phragmitibacter flavus]